MFRLRYSNGSRFCVGIKGQIDEQLTKLPEQVQAKLTDLEKSTGQPKSIIAGGVAVFGVLLFLFLCPQPLVLNIVGCAFPMYASMKALADDAKDELPMWITYWCVFTAFKMVMGPLDFILSFVPFYFYLKLTFLAWLFYPGTKGANFVLEKVIKPYVFPIIKEIKSD